MAKQQHQHEHPHKWYKFMIQQSSTSISTYKKTMTKLTTLKTSEWSPGATLTELVENDAEGSGNLINKRLGKLRSELDWRLFWIWFTFFRLVCLNVFDVKIVHFKIRDHVDAI